VSGTFPVAARCAPAMVRAGAKLVLLFGLYLLLTGQFSTDELVAAALCGLAAAALSVTIPFIAQRHFAFRGVPWRHILVGTFGALATDLVRVGWRLARPRVAPGSIQRWPFTAGRAQPADTARKSLVTVATSVTPNTYVLAVLSGRQEVLVHQLVATKPPQDRNWLQ